MSKKPRGANSSRSSAAAARGTGPKHLSGLETAAVADRGRRRLLDGHQHVTPRRRPMVELTDVDPPEQPERAQPPAALEHVSQAKRSARLQQHFPADDRVRRPAIADDDHVIDQRLDAFGDRDREADASAILGEHRRHRHLRVRKPEVQIFELHRIPGGGNRRFVVGLADLQLQRAPNLCLAQRLRAADGDVRQHGARTFRDDDARTKQCGCRVTAASLGLGGLDRHPAEALRLVEPDQRADRGVEMRGHVEVARASRPAAAGSRRAARRCCR